MTEISPTIEWNDRLEQYFVDTAEKAHSLCWLHKRAQERYAGLKTFIELPAIILGVLNGSVSIGSSTLFGDSPYASVGVGLVALLTAILGAVGTYFKWNARAEQHRISALQYAKLFRFLNVQCSLPRDERMTPAELLKNTKDAYDQLAEISPLVPPPVIAEFKYRFDKPQYKDISKPEECNGLEKVDVYKPIPVTDAPPTSPLPRRPSALIVGNETTTE
jgi:hypothetical protein